VEIALKDIKKLEPAEVNDEFLQNLGFATLDELKGALRDQMLERINADVKTSMREQITAFLIQNVNMALPVKLSDRQAERVISRRRMELMMRGMPQDQVESNIDKLRAGAVEEGARELKLFFILQKIANDMGVDVDEAELNGQIAMLAAQRNARPEKLKQDMSKDGTLANMYVQMREQKAIDRILEKAQIEEVELPAEKKE
jgi:trigger factor